jgi:hypothetical protein
LKLGLRREGRRGELVEDGDAVGEGDGVRGFFLNMEPKDFRGCFAALAVRFRGLGFFFLLGGGLLSVLSVLSLLSSGVDISESGNAQHVKVVVLDLVETVYSTGL